MNQKLNLPYDEGLARDVIAALQGDIFKPDFDPKTIPLEKVLVPLDAIRGIKIYSITEGPGKHKAEMGFGGGMRMPAGEYEVPKGKVYATINTIEVLAGSCATYMFSKQKNGLNLERRDVHMQS